MQATLKNARITPKKVNLVASLIRRESVEGALNTLQFTPKKAAQLLYKLLQSAVSNAETNFNQTKDSLYIEEVKVSKGMRLKRINPISRGRAHPIIKDCSHIQIILGSRVEASSNKTK